MNKDYYYDLCKYCEHLYRCFGREISEKIENNDVKNMYLQSGSCSDYYPERQQ
jgi:hypothetical protein